MKCICGLCMAFENFLGLFLFFLRSLIPKKSSGMQKPYVWLVIPPTKNQHKNSILVHCATSGGFVEVKNCLIWYSASHQHFGSTFVSPSLPNWRTVQWPGSLLTSTIFHYPFARSTPALGHSLMRYIPRKLFVPIRWHCHAKLGMTSHATVQTCTDQLVHFYSTLLWSLTVYNESKGLK